MPSQKLDPRQRLLLAASALATLLVMSMLQCASLPVDHALRGALGVTAVVLAAWCAAILLDDVAVRPLRNALRRLQPRIHPASD
jgi:hypothetical protein